MKKNIKYLMGLAVVVSTCLSTTSCIDETEPTSGVTQAQIDNSPNTISAMMMALPARANVLMHVLVILMTMPSDMQL